MAIPCAGLHPLIFHWVAGIVRALDLVGGANISVVSLDPLTRLEGVAEDLVKNSNEVEASGWVGTLDPNQPPPYNTYPDLGFTSEIGFGVRTCYGLCTTSKRHMMCSSRGKK